MVFFGLKITAILRRLDNLQPLGRCDDPDHQHFIKLQCENCGQISTHFSCVMLSEEVPHPNGRENVNLIQMCEGCGRVGTVKMIPGYGKPFNHVLGKSSRYGQIMIFDSFGDGWKAQSSKRLCHIDLSEGEFTDDDGKGPVDVTGLKAEFEVVNCLCRNRHIYS